MIKGILASKGYAIGTVFIKENGNLNYTRKLDVNIVEEKDRFIKALQKTKDQLIKLVQKTKAEIGEKESAVFESHLTLTEDPELVEGVLTNIEAKGLDAETALRDIRDMFINIFSDIEDEYIRERAADIKDVTTRILRNLLGLEEISISNLPNNTILVAHDLTPSDTAQLNKNKIAAFLTDVGGTTSHSAIIARAMEIPAIVGLKDITSSVKNGDLIIVDAIEGHVILNPDIDTIKEYENKMNEFLREKKELRKYKDIKAVTKSGKHIIVAGNIASPEDVNAVIENGGEGVGLFRTEFLYMNSITLPTEEEQFQAYKHVAEKMKDYPVIIRTLDIGGDKKLSYLNIPHEMNPFLGYRAIRLCLDRKDIFKTQLRAILRASAFGNIKIMFPMISSIEEFQAAKAILQKCMTELKAEKVNFNENLEVGIMVEVPSAAILADELARYVDFFSIGTNDLIQYALAVDRMNEKVSYLYNPFHPAVLRLIKMTIDAAHKEGKWCGMCGEMASDEEAVTLLLDYGLDEFSTTSSSILKVKQTIISY